MEWRCFPPFLIFSPHLASTVSFHLTPQPEPFRHIQQPSTVRTSSALLVLAASVALGVAASPLSERGVVQLYAAARRDGDDDDDGPRIVGVIASHGIFGPGGPPTDIFGSFPFPTASAASPSDAPADEGSSSVGSTINTAAGTLAGFTSSPRPTSVQADPVSSSITSAAPASPTVQRSVPSTAPNGASVNTQGIHAAAGSLVLAAAAFLL